MNNSHANSIRINKSRDLDGIRNYKASMKRSNNKTVDSFGNLGFKGDGREDPQFNPHFAYNLRKVIYQLICSPLSREV